MPNLTCDHSLSDLLALVDPTADPNFENALYDPSYYADWDKGPYTINIYYKGVPVDFGVWYFPGSMSIESIDGFEPGQCSFEIWDWCPDHFNLPWIPVGQMEIKIGNRNGTDWFFRGRVQDVQYRHFNRRPDGTENRRLTITCVDMKTDFKRWIVTEVYNNVTTYAIIKDLVRNHTPFDDSLIDPTKGFKLTGYAVNKRYPADAIQELLDLEVSTVITLDPDTLQVRLDDIASPTFNFLTVGEGDVYDYFLPEEFSLSPQNLVLRNRVIFWFSGVYTIGTVAVTNGSRTVIGTGTKWKSILRNGGRFEIEGDSASYTIEEVNSDTDVRLTSPVNRTTVTGVTYRASSFRDMVVVDDVDSIATMAAILNESFERAGVFEVKMPERAGGMTRDQARSLAQAYVNRMVKNMIVRGQAKSKNYKVNTPGLQAGWSITFDLEVSRKINSAVKIAKLTMLDKSGGDVDRRTDVTKSWYDGIRQDPIHDLTFDFTDRRLLLEAVLERTLQDVREVQITDDDLIEVVATARELLMIADCVGVVPNVGPNGQVQPDGTTNPAEEMSLSDEAMVTDVDPTQLYYAAPVNPGQNEAWTLGSGHWAFAA